MIQMPKGPTELTWEQENIPPMDLRYKRPEAAEALFGTERDPRWTTCHCAEPNLVICISCKPGKEMCLDCGMKRVGA
jgi:hypothetical protein